jgi:hypothetical protein
MKIKAKTAWALKSSIVWTVAIITLAVASPATAGTQDLLTATDDSADTSVPVADLPMVTITTGATQGGNNATSTLVSVGGLALTDVAAISVYYQATLVTSFVPTTTLTDVSISLPGNQKGGQDWTYFISLNASAAGKTFDFTVTSIVGSDDNATVVPFTTAPRTATAPNALPTVTISNPDGTGIIGGAGPYNVSGTASDSDGTVTGVQLRIQRQDTSDHWNGSGWVVAETWVTPVDGGSWATWSYSWAWTSDLETNVIVTAEATDDKAAIGSDQVNQAVDTLLPELPQVFDSKPCHRAGTPTLPCSRTGRKPTPVRRDSTMTSTAPDTLGTSTALQGTAHPGQLTSRSTVTMFSTVLPATTQIVLATDRLSLSTVDRTTSCL